jgi:hypothetical protein
MNFWPILYSFNDFCQQKKVQCWMVGRLVNFELEMIWKERGLVYIKALSLAKWRRISIRIAGTWDKTFYLSGIHWLVMDVFFRILSTIWITKIFEHSEAGFASILQDPILWAPLDIGLSSSNHQYQNSFSGPVAKKSTIQLEVNYSNTRLSLNLIYRYLILELQLCIN